MATAAGAAVTLTRRFTATAAGAAVTERLMAGLTVTPRRPTPGSTATAGPTRRQATAPTAPMVATALTVLPTVAAALTVLPTAAAAVTATHRFMVTAAGAAVTVLTV